MIPERRLETLLEQSKAYQKSTCPYHTSDEPISLLIDHNCSRRAFPNATLHCLKDHSDEVWTLAFSHDGRFLATAGADRRILIWSVEVGR